MKYAVKVMFLLILRVKNNTKNQNVEKKKEVFESNYL